MGFGALPPPLPYKVNVADTSRQAYLKRVYSIEQLATSGPGFQRRLLPSVFYRPMQQRWSMPEQSQAFSANRILSKLSPADRRKMGTGLKPISVSLGEILNESEAR